MQTTSVRDGMKYLESTKIVGKKKREETRETKKKRRFFANMWEADFRCGKGEGGRLQCCENTDFDFSLVARNSDQGPYRGKGGQGEVRDSVRIGRLRDKAWQTPKRDNKLTRDVGV